MRSLISIVTILILAGCGSSGGGGSVSVDAMALAGQDPLVGGYYFAGQFQSTGGLYFSGIRIEPGNKVTVTDLATQNSVSTIFHMRKNVGTYVKNGDQVTITWSYETCDPVGTSVVTISASNPSDRILVTSDNTTVQYLNIVKWPIDDGGVANTAVAAIEDVACNKFPE